MQAELSLADDPVGAEKEPPPGHALRIGPSQTSM